MPTKKRLTYRQRIPAAVYGIQVNFCKNPKCPNFGVPPLENIKGRILPPRVATAPGVKPPPRRHDYYTIGKKHGVPSVKCQHCNESPPMKSNYAVYVESARMLYYLVPRKGKEPSCPNKGCPNHAVGLNAGLNAAKKSYHRYGKQTGVSIRYQCLECMGTFSVKSSPEAGQNKKDVNELIYKLAVNKVPLQRMCEIADVSMSTLYNKLDFLSKQCQLFCGEHDRKLQQMEFKRLQISIDRQGYMVNWIEADDKRNVMVYATASADNRSGFVFGVHLNIGSDIEAAAVEISSVTEGDLAKAPPFRHNAQYWLKPDFEDARRQAASTKKKEDKGEVRDRIIKSYEEAEEREDIEAFERMDGTLKLPTSGILKHGEYTVYGHLQFLKKLLPNVEKIRFYIEQESGMRAACFAAYHEEILGKTCEAFYVRINKDMTVPQKVQAVVQGERELEHFAEDNGHAALSLSKWSLRALKIEDMIAKGEFQLYGKFKDKWYNYPAPSMNEPQKAVCWLTDTGSRTYTDFELAKMIGRASLFGVDRFFMLVRRRISLLERPIGSSSNAGRRWYGYSPYRPENIERLLTIFRTYHNYVKVGDKDKKTPAMRLGLVDRPVPLQEIIKFMP